MKPDEVNWTAMVDTEKILNKRILSLENDCDHIAKITQRNNSRTIEIYEQFNDELKLVKNRVEELKIGMKNCVIEMDILIGKIRQSAKNDEIKMVSDRIDNFNAEGLITKFELARTLDN
jgi:hypothetical protein